MLCVVEAVKGGVGKSVTTVYLAEAWARAGRRVLVVDADPQGTVLEWDARAEDAGEPLTADVEGLPSAVLINRRLAGLAGGYEDVFVDCPNRDVAIIEAALGLADLAIVPMVPGVEELRRCEDGRRLAHRAGVDTRVLLTMVDLRTTLAGEVLHLLDAEDVPRFRSVVRRRADISAVVGAARPETLHDYAHVASELEEVVHAPPVRA